MSALPQAVGRSQTATMAPPSRQPPTTPSTVPTMVPVELLVRSPGPLLPGAGAGLGVGSGTAPVTEPAVAQETAPSALGGSAAAQVWHAVAPRDDWNSPTGQSAQVDAAAALEKAPLAQGVHTSEAGVKA